MDKQQEGRWVLPNPQVPRSFGLMNIIFGSMLLLFGLGQAALTIYSPVLFKGIEDQARRQLEEQKAKRQTKIAELKDKVKAAKTEEEKKDLVMELQALQSNQGLDPALFDQMKSLQTDRRIAIYTYTEMSTGILLNLLMIVSGVGLLALAEWSRRLAIATAWLKIARWVAIVAATTFVIVPITTEKMQPMFRSIEKQTAGRPGGRAASFGASNLAEFSAVANVVAAVGAALVAVVYPVCVIWFLTRPPARAACLAAKRSRAEGLDRELAGP